jgi:hypothetical protein
MKRCILLFIIIIGITLTSCNSGADTKITFRNDSAGSLFINFRGELITVASGTSTIISDVPIGKFGYSTTYEVPAGVTTSRNIGAVSGELNINPGTRVFIHYTSVLSGGDYTVSATISYSDDLSSGVPTTP